MNGSYFGDAGIFLVQTVFGLYALALLLRFLLQWARADFYNPLVQFLVKLTNPPLLPLRRIIPGLFGLDIAALLLVLFVKLLEWGLIYNILGQQTNIAGLSVIALADTLNLLVNIGFWSILIRAIMSWFNPDPRQPIVVLIVQLTEPILRPARQLIPSFSGLDLSPLLVLLLLQLTKLLLITPLWDGGRQLL
jgi:YggT family protein